MPAFTTAAFMKYLPAAAAAGAFAAVSGAGYLLSQQQRPVWASGGPGHRDGEPPLELLERVPPRYVAGG